MADAESQMNQFRQYAHLKKNLFTLVHSGAEV
jgi:hypothetical protein